MISRRFYKALIDYIDARIEYLLDVDHGRVDILQNTYTEEAALEAASKGEDIPDYLEKPSWWDSVHD